MLKRLNILVPKETREFEKRVALTPSSVKKIVSLGHQVRIEAEAGANAGFSDSEQEKSGAMVQPKEELSSGYLQNLLKEINCIIRVKRPNRIREEQEHKALFQQTPRIAGLTMLGFLDPQDSVYPHVKEQAEAGMSCVSLDQVKREFLSDSRMHVVGEMSKITGRLAMEEALQLTKGHYVTNVLIIGTGNCAITAAETAFQKNLNVTVQGRSEKYKEKFESMANVTQKQEGAVDIDSHDIAITCAKVLGERAPILITKEQLMQCQRLRLVIDLSRTEGGNVQGSVDDGNVSIGKVTVRNVTGYPKRDPNNASIAFSTGMELLLSEFSSSNITSLQNFISQHSALSGSMFVSNGIIDKKFSQSSPSSSREEIKNPKIDSKL